MATFYTGNSGASTGPHLDMRVFNPATGKYENPGKYTQYITNADGSAFSAPVTSGFQPGGRVHPVHGDVRPHNGIDYATELGTGLNINGSHLSTWEDSGGGGIMSQYLINTDDGNREILMLHGNDQNKITGSGAVTDYDPSNLTPSVPKPSSDTQSEAIERAQNYSEMSKAELNTAYDAMRSDPAKAREEGMKMHKAFFNK